MYYIILILLVYTVNGQKWVTEFDTIKDLVHSGHLVVIENALKNPDDYIQNITYSTKTGWTRDHRVWWNGYIGSGDKFTKDIMIPYKKLWGELAMIDGPIKFYMDSTKYEKNDYIEAHTDYDLQGRSRELTVLLHLTRDFPVECGGELVWCGFEGCKVIRPSWNTLYIFKPHPSSWHIINRIQCGVRKAIGGFVYTDIISEQSKTYHQVFGNANNKIKYL